jgi:hypothetical protein
MSNSAAIAAVTAALRNLLAEAISQDPELADTVFTMQPPDIARVDGVTANQVNLFLFRTAVNAAWSNQAVPDSARQGEDSPPPLALTLSYMLTAYGRENDAQRPFSHLLLGRSMSVLHDNPILMPEVLRSSLPDIGWPTRFERVRLTLQPMSLDDLSKLWSGFQTQFRLSSIYEASVVLIESNRPAHAALPVLLRGRRGTGITTQADMMPPGPILVNVQPNAVTVGDVVSLCGMHLAGDRVSVRLIRNDRSWDFPVPPGSPDEKIDFAIPADHGLGAGVHGACVIVGPPGEGLASNVIALAIMPRIVSRLPMTARLRAGGSIEVTVEVAPPALPGQRVGLLLGSHETRGPRVDAPQTRLHFVVPAIEPRQYILRLRVDGVDSPTVRITEGALPQFDPAARLTVTP